MNTSTPLLCRLDLLNVTRAVRSHFVQFYHNCIMLNVKNIKRHGVQFTLYNIIMRSLVAQWLRQAFQGHEKGIVHDVKDMASKSNWAELGVHSTFV